MGRTQCSCLLNRSRLKHRSQLVDQTIRSLNVGMSWSLQDHIMLNQLLHVQQGAVNLTITAAVTPSLVNLCWMRGVVCGASSIQLINITASSAPRR